MSGKRTLARPYPTDRRPNFRFSDVSPECWFVWVVVLVGAASLVAGCATVYVVEEDEEASAPVVPPDPCAELVGREACCGAGCVWLMPTETMPAFCFSLDRECNARGCEAGQACYSHDGSLGQGDCGRNYGFVEDEPFGLCVDACPAALTRSFETCEP